MKNNKGFTLLELLVAATIIGILAVFATTSYKNSAADARIVAAKTLTDTLANAVQRMRIEYPAFKNVSGQMRDKAVSSTDECSPTAVSGLVSCGLLGNNNWERDSYMTYWVCNGKTGKCASSPVDNPLACMVSNEDAKMPARYGTGYIYCVSAVAKQETLAAGS